MNKSFTNKNLDSLKTRNLNWTIIQTEMKSKLGAEVYESWLKKINFLDEFNNYILLTVPTRFIRDWITSRYLDQILKIVRNYKKDIVRIEFKIDDNILVKSDRVSMGHHLELRVPFLDHHLVEWVNSLPVSYKLRGFQTKALLKEAIRSDLPDSIIDRPKAGFNVPMARWLMGPLVEVCDEYLNSHAIRQEGLWDPIYVQEMRTLHQKSKMDLSRPLWAMLCFRIFSKQIQTL